MSSTESVTPMSAVMNGYLTLLDQNVNASIFKYSADIILMIAGLVAILLASTSYNVWQTYAGLGTLIAVCLTIRTIANRIVMYTQSELDIAQK